MVDNHAGSWAGHTWALLFSARSLMTSKAATVRS